MMILTIDPGDVKSAFVIYDTDTKELIEFGISDNHELVDIIEAADPCDPFDDTEKLVIEMIASYGMPVGKNIFDTCAWIGRFENAFGLDNSCRVYRKDVKMHLCNSMRAKDSNIRQAILNRYPATGGGKTPQIGTKGQPGPLYGVKKDIWSALAVAITFMESGDKKR